MNFKKIKCVNTSLRVAMRSERVLNSGLATYVNPGSICSRSGLICELFAHNPACTLASCNFSKTFSLKTAEKDNKTNQSSTENKKW